MLAVTRLDFAPTTSLLGLSIRLETLALAGAILLALLIAALQTNRSRFLLGVLVAEGAALLLGDRLGCPIPVQVALYVVIPPLILLALALNEGISPRRVFGSGETGDSAPALRRDDLILIAFGAIPGAVLGGRLSYAFIHYDYYSADWRAVTDPAQGGFGLTLAVALGTLTAVAVARLLAAPINRWLGVAAVPVLIALGLGKLAMVLGGSGQGSYSDASWATRYLGQGPWGSLNPSFAALPSQALEGGLVLAAAGLVIVMPFLLRLRLRRSTHFVRPALAPQREWSFLTGRGRYLTAIGLWVAARFLVEFTWRDGRVLGPLVADQLVLLLAVAGTATVALAPAARRGLPRLSARWAAAADGAAGPAKDPSEGLAEPKGLRPVEPEGLAEPKGLPPARPDRPD